MRNVKRILSIMLATVVLLSIMAGCAGKPSVSDGEESKTSENTKNNASKPMEGTTISVLLDNDSTYDAPLAVMAEIEKKLGIKSELEYKPGGTEGDNLMKTRLASGDMPDIVAYNCGSLFRQLNPTEHFYDLSDQPFASKLNKVYKENVSVDGKLYGIPVVSMEVGAWLYNIPIYKELGLSIPKTWDEFTANCDKIKASGKADAIIGSYKDTWTSQILYLGDYFNVQHAMPDFAEKYTANQAKFATIPIALRSWEKLYDTNKYMNKDYLATTINDAIEKLVNGEGAQWCILSRMLSNIYSLYPDKIDDIGVFPVPGDTPDSSGLTTWMPTSFYMNKDCKEVEAALKWMDFYISDEGLNIYTSVTRPDGPFAIDGYSSDSSYYAVTQMQEYFESGKSAPALEFVSPVKGSNCEQFTVECGSNMKPALDCAKEYDKDVEKQAVQLGLKGW